ncbi:tetratricopeptide repeat protein [Archangium violaceum]|uniref:tetratricopeptide repeat protein n=1 Tax=Archangium violaceum TaxID=83451 RepID=UPI00193B4859|nr:tetratricopeptide repeat protein [Archangium violaceum]QRK10533.1 tetratricopeptide repeat protein [Archangium violaceum]
MTTLTDHPFRPPLANCPSLKTWFGGLQLLSALLMSTGFGGIILLLCEQEVAVGGLSLSVTLASLFCVGMALEQWRHWWVGTLARRGWEQLLTGRLDAAIRSFDVAVSGGRAEQRGWSHYGLTLAWLRKGDYARALALCEAAPHPWGKMTASVRGARGPALKALILALSGEPDAARRQVAELRRPMFDRTDYALLAQAVMFCREGKYVEAVKRIQQSPRENVPEMDVGAVAVLHAFARGRLAGQLVPLKSGCVMPEKPARASGHEYLAREWPELAAWFRGEGVRA